MFSWCQTICSTQILTFLLLNKESLCKLIITHGRHMLYQDSFHCVSAHVLREAQLAAYDYSLPRLQARLTWSRTLLSISRAQLSFTETLLRLSAPCELSRFCPPSDKESGPHCKMIFLTPHARASRSSSLLIQEDHMLNRGHSSSLCWKTTFLK